MKKNLSNTAVWRVLIITLLVIGFGVGVPVGMSIEGASCDDCTAATEKTDTKAGTEKNNEKNKNLSSLGYFTATAYCSCSECCGKSDGITATGATATAGRTIAVDPSVIPYGTEVIINGHTYIAEDSGGAIKGNCVDIFFNSHKEALTFGVQSLEVFARDVTL